MRDVKGLALLVLLAAGVAEADALAPEVDARKTFLGLSIVPGVPRVLGSLGLEVERALGERVSVRLGVSASTNWGASKYGTSELSSQSFELVADPGIRFYLTGRALSGLWVGPSIELQRAWGSSESMPLFPDWPPGEVSSRRWSVGASALVGYSMVLREGLTVQAGVGFGVSRGWSRDTIAGGGLGGVLVSGAQLQPLQPAVSESRGTSWDFSERVSLAVGWAF